MSFSRVAGRVLSIGFCTVLLYGTALSPFSSPAFGQEENRTNAPKTDSAARDSSASSDENDTYAQLSLFGEVFERVRANYVEPVSDKVLIEHALNGMLSNLDPHSSYLNEKDFADMQIQTKGEFGGLGIEVTMENGFVKVVSPIDDTPAARAGIHSGDYIIQIDGTPVMGMTLNDAVDKMRGKVGTTVELSVRRQGVEKVLPFTLKRDVIRIKSVKFRVEDNTIGYIRVTSFNQNTVDGVEDAIRSIRKTVGDEPLRGYVLDLRNNPGGLLDQAIGLADLFLEKGEIVSTRGRHEEDTKRDNATPGDMTQGKPIVVLINGGSASASEIVSGALQDHHRAILLGTKSFGKGSVQTIIPLRDNNAMRLTTARYYTPSGRSIQAKGIEPDIVVEQAKVEALSSVEDIHESDLVGALDNDKNNVSSKKADQEKKKGSFDPRSVEKQNASQNQGEPAQGNDGDSKADQDYQLSRALDLIRGVSLYQGQDKTMQPPAQP